MAETLDAQFAEFAERNLFLLMSLGLLSIGDRLDTLLRVHAPGAPHAAGQQAAHPPDSLSCMLLGAIRFHEVVRRELGLAADESVTPPLAQPDDRPPALSPGNLLR